MKSRKLAGRSLVAVIFIALVLFGVFQNCSNVSLYQVQFKAEKPEPPQIDLKASFCPKVEAGEGTKSKFIFILDMSGSNLGGWRLRQEPYYYRFDPGMGFDPQGLRFEAVKEFVDRCGESMTDNIVPSYSLIGFSDTAGLVSSNRDTKLSCDTVDFFEESTFIEKVNLLEQIQNREVNGYSVWDWNSGRDWGYGDVAPPLMKGTNYGAASACLKTLLANDLSDLDSYDFDGYQIFFLSDGKPDADACADAHPDDPEAQAACYFEETIPPLETVTQLALSRNKSVRIYSVYYGGEEEVPPLMNDLAKAGESENTYKLDNLATEGLDFCKIVDLQVNFEYRPDNIAVFNLLTTLREGVVEADSDMDGVSDKEEIRLGWDPSQQRSTGVSGVLDGICHQLGGYSKCLERRQRVSCNPGMLNHWGLTDCDIKVLDLPYRENSDWGVDSDLDGVVDYIEIVRGTDPKRNDMSLDPDGDGFINMQELTLGLDPRHHDKEIDWDLVNQFEVKPKENSSEICKGSEWEISMDKVQAVPRLVEVNGHGDKFFPERESDESQAWFEINHKKDQMSLIITYRMNSQNRNINEFQYYGSNIFLENNEDGYLVPREGANTSLSNQEFGYFGRVVEE